MSVKKEFMIIQLIKKKYLIICLVFLLIAAFIPEWFYIKYEGDLDDYDPGTQSWHLGLFWGLYFQYEDGHHGSDIYLYGTPIEIEYHTSFGYNPISPTIFFSILIIHIISILIILLLIKRSRIGFHNESISKENKNDIFQKINNKWLLLVGFSLLIIQVIAIIFIQLLITGGYETNYILFAYDSFNSPNYNENTLIMPSISFYIQIVTFIIYSLGLFLNIKDRKKMIVEPLE